MPGGRDRLLKFFNHLIQSIYSLFCFNYFASAFLYIPYSSYSDDNSNQNDYDDDRCLTLVWDFNSKARFSALNVFFSFSTFVDSILKKLSR